jgi:hypothetical protein
MTSDVQRAGLLCASSGLVKRSAVQKSQLMRTRAWQKSGNGLLRSEKPTGTRQTLRDKQKHAPVKPFVTLSNTSYQTHDYVAAMMASKRKASFDTREDDYGTAMS